MRFVADTMLGRLARWLRIVGQDVAYGPHLSGARLVQTARREDRMILTRNTRLIRRRELPPYLFIVSDHFRDQLRQVLSSFNLKPTAFLTRCLDCNEELSRADRALVHLRVPPYVWATQEHFQACPRCGRIFWGATHRQHIREELRGLGVVLPVGDDPTPRTQSG